jgi:hypothetical protein
VELCCCGRPPRKSCFSWNRPVCRSTPAKATTVQLDDVVAGGGHGGIGGGGRGGDGDGITAIGIGNEHTSTSGGGPTMAARAVSQGNGRTTSIADPDTTAATTITTTTSNNHNNGDDMAERLAAYRLYLSQHRFIFPPNVLFQVRTGGRTCVPAVEARGMEERARCWCMVLLLRQPQPRECGTPSCSRSCSQSD